MIRHVVLVGLSGTGKSSVGRAAALELGWELVDTDDEIERRTGKSIPDIFRDDGEAAFREIEQGVLREALSRDQVVVATGGGAVVDPRVWSSTLLASSQSLAIWLDADAATLIERLRTQAATIGAAADRPLLAGNNALARLGLLRDQRVEAYTRADIALDVSARTVSEVTADIVDMARLGCGQELRIDLDVATAHSAIHVGVGARFRAGELIRQRWPKARRIWVAIDANLEPQLQDEIETMRETSAMRVEVLPVPSGEASKSMLGLERLHDWMLGSGIERDDIVVAMGGGMVGDLAGFAAATVLRGVGLMQLPSTLLSMVDSSVGGKTGINHRHGKNLIGAFYQPAEVVIDSSFLGSLPQRELRSGWAEIVKHAVIEPSVPGKSAGALLGVLERNVSALLALSNPIVHWTIGRNVALKAAVVEADEREAGIRAYLNFGHTIGHGIEAAGYSLLHGEAVAVGMCASLFIARELDLIDESFENRIRELIVAFGLPVRAEVDSDLVRQMTKTDKKKSAGRQKWVLPVRNGGVTITTDVPEELAQRAIRNVTGAA